MLLIYLPVATSRSEYIFELIFKHELGIEYSTTSDNKFFEAYQQEKINYSAFRFGKEIFIKSTPLLFEHTIKKINISVEKKQGILVLFANDATCDVGFDIFASVFYMVSRYEEYLSFTPDKHGRFRAMDSIAYKNNFLQLPVVNIWIQYLKKILHEKFPSLQWQHSSFKAIITYDIDIAYAFKGRGLFRFTAAMAKDFFTLKFKNIFKRFQSLSAKKDPWDVYDYLKETIIKNNVSSVFFFLLADYSSHDKNIPHDHPLMIDLIQKISTYSEIGIHPSYKSSKNAVKILKEKIRLEKIINKPITKSRQHYLKFTLPDTYNHLATAGITEDYSMGFADIPGFRAGTCKPFYFYDLLNERSTGFKIFPITVMEAAFLYYLKLKPAECLQIIFNLINEVKNVDGTFISIWHNNSLSTDSIYKEWKWVHNEMIKRISSG